MTENTTWPGWRQVRKLGSGSFGTVYEICREDDPSYRAALKVITIPQDESELNSVYSQGMNDDSVSSYFEGMVEDVTQEIAVMDQFKGLTNIVSYEEHKVIKHQNDIGWDILIRMELLTPLQTYERERGYGLTEEKIIRLGKDICQALIMCEKCHIIHRDIKPENIFINRFGDFVLGDFGIARQMEKSMGSMSVKGTYNYMAPEVYNGQHYGKTADIYSLGMVLYRCLNNNRGPFLPPAPQPITFQEMKKATSRRMNGDPLPSPQKGSLALKIIVKKATSYNPDDRYLNAEEFKEALDRNLVESIKKSDIRYDFYEDGRRNQSGIDSEEMRLTQNTVLNENDDPDIEDVTVSDNSCSDKDSIIKNQSSKVQENKDSEITKVDIEEQGTVHGNSSYVKSGITEIINTKRDVIKQNKTQQNKKYENTKSEKTKEGGYAWYFGILVLVMFILSICVVLSWNNEDNSEINATDSSEVVEESLTKPDIFASFVSDEKKQKQYVNIRTLLFKEKPDDFFIQRSEAGTDKWFTIYSDEGSSLRKVYEYKDIYEFSMKDNLENTNQGVEYVYRTVAKYGDNIIRSENSDNVKIL